MAIALGACASTDPEFTRARESWRGAAYDDVVQEWGPPNRIVPGSPEKHVWLTEDHVPEQQRSGSTFGGISIGVGGSRGNVGVGVGMGAGGAMYPPSSVLVRCERALSISNGVVVGEDWAGDPEFCKRFGRR